MASNDTNSIALGVKQGPNAQDLDKIANNMDDMLKNMKQNITKSRWNELCNSTFNSLDVTRSAVKNSSHSNQKQVLATIHEDKIYNPVPSTEENVEIVRKVNKDVGMKMELPLSEKSKIDGPTNSVKSNTNKQTVKQSTKISTEKSKNSTASNNKSSKNRTASPKKDPQIMKNVSDSKRPHTEPMNSPQKPASVKKPISQNVSRTNPSINKKLVTLMAPVSTDNKTNELNSTKKNKPTSSLRPALPKPKLQTEDKNKDNMKTKSDITQSNPKNIPTTQSTKLPSRVQPLNSKQITSNPVLPNSKQIKNMKNDIVKQTQNKNMPKLYKKPQNIGDNKTKLTNNPTSSNTKPEATNKEMENSKSKENDKKPRQTSNGTINTARKNGEPVIQTILVSNETQNKPSVDSKFLITPSDLGLHSLYYNNELNNLIMQYVTVVNKAKREHKTYTITGNFQPLRCAFAERGWIEKVRELVCSDRDNWKKMENLSNLELAEGIFKNRGPKYRRALISKMLCGHQVDFYWDYSTNPFTGNSDKVKRTLINRFPFNANRCYCTKVGLCNSLIDSQWYNIDGFANVVAPRTYNLASEDEIQEFIDDFRLTAAISLMKWIDENSTNPSNIVSDKGTVPMSIFNFAVLQIANFLRVKEHRDIDEDIALAASSEWDVFLEKYYVIMQDGKQFIESDRQKASYMFRQVKYLLQSLKRYLPDLKLDGMMNLWLMKPHRGSRGCGILVCRTLKFILDRVQTKKETKYIVQKYIERPLLIYDTKFDIRQWFLVTCMPCLKVWMYKKCYLRFSSQMFDLKKLNESIHLTNNAVQCKYKNCVRNAKLPLENMWHSDTFKQYLHEMGYPFVWQNIIYRGMKEALVALHMTCQTKMATRINSFELFGADFMVSEAFKPYLIEINSRPAIHGSTKITADLCPKVLADVIKVTVDHARNPKASTGHFEPIYTDSLSYALPKTIEDIDTFHVEGKSCSIQTANEDTQPMIDFSDSVLNRATRKTNMIERILKINPTTVKKDAKDALEKILQIIQCEQMKLIDKRSNTMQVRHLLSEYVDIISNNDEETKKSYDHKLQNIINPLQ